MSWTPKAEKDALRQRVRATLRELSSEKAAETDRLILERLVALSAYTRAERIFLYVGIFPEIETAPLLARAVRDGKCVALPKSRPGGIMDFYAYEGQLVPGLYGIPEPVSDKLLYPGERDLLIVPGLGFTPEGKRLGQGGGYYDRYLEKHPCKTVALCRQAQMLSSIPTQWNDLPVEFVLTERNFYSK